MENNKKYYVLTNILMLVIFGSLIFPVVYLLGFGIRLGDILVLTIIPILYLYKPLVPRERFFYLYLLMMFCFMLSTVYGYVFLSVKPSYSDWFEILRLSFPLLLTLALLNADKQKLIKTLINFLYYGSIFIIVLGVVQYMFPRSIGYFLTSFYNDGAQLQIYSECRTRRVLLTGSDPNTGAAIGLLFLCFNMVMFFVMKKFRFLLMGLLLFIILLLTGSRTGLAAFLLSFTFIIMFMDSNSKKYKFFIMFVILAMLLLIIPKIPYIYIGITTLFQGENTSLLARFVKVKVAYNLFTQSPIFGWGPAKGMHITVVDSEWFLLLRRYGIVGMFTFLSFMFYNNFRIYFNRKIMYLNDRGLYALSMLVIAYSLTLFVVMLTNNFLSGYQLLLPYCLITFAVHFRLSQLKKANKEEHIIGSK